MRSGGKGMWGRGPALYKQNYIKIKKIKKINSTQSLFFFSKYGVLQTVLRIYQAIVTRKNLYS
jgi:hypothetical protein